VVAFLSGPAAYGLGIGDVARQETHMSWIFFVDDLVYKLKKPVRFAYLDFSTLPQRAAACLAEVSLNRPLAPEIYLGVTPLTVGPQGLTLGGEGEVVDWLVKMRRLDARRGLDRRLTEAPPSPAELEGLAKALARFYRHTPRVRTTPALRRLLWRRALDADREVLLQPRLGLPAAQVRRVDAVLRRVMRTHGDWLGERVRRRRILDAHGDLRPEHIWLGDGVKIIDRLEFNAMLRASDPLDELAYLDLECERLGFPAVGRRISKSVRRRLHDRAPEALVLFYRCHRALLRARLSIAHLLEPFPRTPEKWPRQAAAYLAIAVRDARRLEVSLNRPAGR
jgi:aminoglycoside phosphotransferase family enzyme